MDRNTNFFPASLFDLVALRKESVDRNTYYFRRFLKCCLSLSARRAWIEIMRQTPLTRFFPVALRKESVDRNGLGICHYRDDVSSLSARRAWIEIDIDDKFGGLLSGRSPQGERG